MTDQLHDHLDVPAVDAPDAPGGGGGAGINRRRMFLAGAGIAGAAALAKAGSASAADGDPALTGEVNEGADGPTLFRNTNTTATDAGTAGQEALVGDISDAANGSNAIVGSTAGAGAAVRGTSTSGVGGEFVGGLAHLRLAQTADPDTSGAPTGDGHLLGELYVDPAGNLWFNTADGESFTQLNDQPGRMTILGDPQRAFDSREEFTDPANTNKGRFTAGETREIDLTEFTDLPAGATGAVINLTVSGTGDAGFVTVFNADTDDADRPNVSSINWVAPGSIVANGLTVPVSTTGTVKVYALEETEVVIDLTGYLT